MKFVTFAVVVFLVVFFLIVVTVPHSSGPINTEKCERAIQKSFRNPVDEDLAEAAVEACR